MKNYFQNTPSSRKKKIQFRIFESIAYFQIPISSNHGALFQMKNQGQFQDLKIVGCRKKNIGMEEEKANL